MEKSSVDTLQQNLPPPGIYGLAVVFKIQPQMDEDGLTLVIITIARGFW